MPGKIAASCPLSRKILTVSRFVQVIESKPLLSGDADFIIEFKVYEVKTNIEVASIIDLRTPVYGMIKITDDFPQDLDVHLRKITADEDNVAGGLEFPLIADG